MQSNPSRITFLDVKIYKDPNNVLSCKLFRKPTAGNTILHSESFHPRPLVNLIPYSQYFQIKHNCSNDTDFQHEVRGLKQCLREKGYSHKCLKKALNRAANKNRHNLLFSHKKEVTNPNEYTRIITTYANKHLKVKQIFNKLWHILPSDPTIGPFVPSAPLVTYRRVSSVGDILVKSEFKGCTRGDPCKLLGTFPCDSCKCCCYMDTPKNNVKM